jgi:hypothetical protein
LGYGALHRLPAPLSEPLAGPGETLFETENARFSNEENRPLSGATDSQFFVPAAAATPSGDFLVPATLVGPPQGGTPAKKRDKRHGHSPNKVMLDDYFMEGEKKSRELDHAPSAKSTPPPPPPKAGGPPRAGPPSRTETPTVESVPDTQASVDGSVD